MKRQRAHIYIIIVFFFCTKRRRNSVAQPFDCVRSTCSYWPVVKHQRNKSQKEKEEGIIVVGPL